MPEELSLPRVTLRQQSCTLQRSFPLPWICPLRTTALDHSSERNFTWRKPFYLLPSWAQRGLPSVSPHTTAVASPCQLWALLPQLLGKTQALPKEEHKEHIGVILLPRRRAGDTGWRNCWEPQNSLTGCTTLLPWPRGAGDHSAH